MFVGEFNEVRTNKDELWKPQWMEGREHITHKPKDSIGESQDTQQEIVEVRPGTPGAEDELGESMKDAKFGQTSTGSKAVMLGKTSKLPKHWCKTVETTDPLTELMKDDDGHMTDSKFRVHSGFINLPTPPTVANSDYAYIPEMDHKQRNHFHKRDAFTVYAEAQQLHNNMMKQ